MITNGAPIETINKDGRTTAFIAAIDHQVDDLNTLIDLGANINHRDNDGDTALLVLAKGGQIDAVAKLMALGADVNILNNEGLNAYTVAANKYLISGKQRYLDLMNLIYQNTERLELDRCISIQDDFDKLIIKF